MYVVFSPQIYLGVFVFYYQSSHPIIINVASWIIMASASLKFLTICSGVCNLRFIWVSFL